MRLSCRRSVLFVGLTFVAFPWTAAGQSRNAEHYLFLIQSSATVSEGSFVRGNMAVNAPGGVLNVSPRGTAFADGTEIVADTVNVNEGSRAWDIFSNVGNLRGTYHTLTQPIAPPIYRPEPLVVPDPFDPANYPLGFPITCGGPSRTGAPHESFTLTPGTYESVSIGRGGKVILPSGTYNLCSLEAIIRGGIEVHAPATINVRDLVRIGLASSVIPVGNPSDVQFNLAGSLFRLGRNSTFNARVFAPQATLSLGLTSLVTGHFVARTLREDKNIRASTCGNGMLDPGEQCDVTAPNGDAACPGQCAIPGSPNECTCPTPPTTTITSTTTSTTASTTTSTTTSTTAPSTTSTGTTTPSTAPLPTNTTSTTATTTTSSTTTPPTTTSTTSSTTTSTTPGTCVLSVDKTACVAAPPPSGAICTGGAIALTLKYTGPAISGPTTVTLTGSVSTSVTTTYTLTSLNPGDILTKASENGFTIDATAHGQSRLGPKTTVTINGTAEVLHTSCSCTAMPETNLVVCNPVCLDSSSPDNTTGIKGTPSPLWTLVSLKDPTLGTENCSATTSGECQTNLPAPPPPTKKEKGGTISPGSPGAAVNFTYKITNTGTTTVNNVSVQDDQLGTIPGSPIASIPPGGMVTLTAQQFLAETTVNTVTVSGNNGVCTACAKAAVIAPCVIAYPFASSNPRTSVVFNESEVLRAFAPSVAGPTDRIQAFYNDEHALLLGVSTPSFAVSPFTPAPGAVASFVFHPQTGDPTAPDPFGRPIAPSLFITDITADPGVICTLADTVTPSRCHDWQYGGTRVSPDAVFGTWKAATRSGTSIVTGTDPAKNNYTLDGSGACGTPSDTCPDPVPAGLTNQGYGAEVRWDVSKLGVLPGHIYRMQFMVHDGDQNKTGGDVGQGCATVFVPARACP